MALTGLKINKLLPGTNCKECGSSTCLAFAMKLAGKKADLSACPYASDEAKEVLGAAASPPVASVTLGPDEGLRIGEETCLYRHEKTFVNQTLLAVNLNDDMPVEEANALVDRVRDYVLERVGEELRIELIAFTHRGLEPEKFALRAREISDRAQRPLVVRSNDADVLAAAAAALQGRRCVLASASPENFEVLVQTATEHGHCLSVTAPDLDALVGVTGKLAEDGFNPVLLELPAVSAAERFQVNSIARRAAIRDGYKPLGFPFLRFVEDGNEADTHAAAVTEIAKYAGILALPDFDPAQVVSLLTLRQNIYTDPQKPIQVEPRLYPVGEPDEDAPVFVTTNFSLTYFIVSGEIENAGLNAWLVVPECEGMSVLTAWAAGKFSGSTIAGFIKEQGIADQCKRREIVIPGYVAQISGELEEELPGWKVVVGPQEAGDLESFVKSHYADGTLPSA